MSYCKLPAFVLGFHGCDEKTKRNLLLKKTLLKLSKNEYDWLGSGIYFWENDPERALSYAKELSQNPKRSKKANIENPAVVGAIIDLGHCLNLFEKENLELVKTAYITLEKLSQKNNTSLPVNKLGKDLLLRNLDCAVINVLHQLIEKNHFEPFDSVRAPFWEGERLYPNAGFREKNHVQICIRNPKCIKGYFDPLNGSNRISL